MKYHTYLTHQFNGTKVILDGLKAKTTYTISMVASTSRENGDESDSTSVTTCEFLLLCIDTVCQTYPSQLYLENLYVNIHLIDEGRLMVEFEVTFLDETLVTFQELMIRFPRLPTGGR